MESYVPAIRFVKPAPAQPASTRAGTSPALRRRLSLDAGPGLENKETDMLRKAAFAHDWYPGEPQTLASTIRSYLGEQGHAHKALGLLCPHAGYIYSGHVAGAVYGRTLVPATVIALGVNHRSLGARVALMGSGSWETPLGTVPIDEKAARLLRHACGLVKEDDIAHLREHSLELQVPFLQYRNPQVEIVPVLLQHLAYEECEEVGRAVAETFGRAEKEILIVASSDMTHFETQKTAEKKDRLAIDRILALDPRGLYTTVHRERISMCGIIPATVMLVACTQLGAKEARLVRYATSGDVSGDYSSVVGYAGVMVL